MAPANTHDAVVKAWERLWLTGRKRKRKRHNHRQNHTRTTSPTNNIDPPIDINQTNKNTSNLHSTTYPEPSKLRRTKHHRHPPISFQSDLHGRPQELLDTEEFGDRLTKKSDQVLRIMLHNINRLPSQRMTIKSKKLMSTLANKQVDIAMLTEVGLYWKLVHHNDQWHERVRESFQSTKTELAFNTTEPQLTAMVQYGGVAVMAIDDIVHRVTSQGKDLTGLGRWAWLRLEGRQGHHTRVVSAYRPVVSNSPGPSTVQAQHERYFGGLDRDEDPRAAFYTDLMAEVNSWKALGDHLIIGIDANEDVRLGDTAQIFASLDMREIILETHQQRMRPPATCDKNTSRNPIDGIFATPGIGVIAGGYSAFNSGCPSDHRYLWVDISYHDAFGYATPPLKAPDVRRLKTKNPEMVKRYNARVVLALQNAGLLDALERVSTTASQHGWSASLEAEYNRINDLQYTLRKHVEKKIRHLRMGAVEWSPKLQSFRIAIEIWSMLLKKRKHNRSISNCKLRRLLGKTDITDAYHKSIPEIEDALTLAFRNYRLAHESSAIWRDEFMESLATSRARAKGTEVENELKQLRSIEQQRRVARNIKRMQGKLQRNATLQVIVNDRDGRHVLTTKEDMEDACITENIARFSQSEDTPPMTEPLVSHLGYLADTHESEAILQGTYVAPEGVDYYTRLLLRELRMPDNVRTKPMPTVTITPATNRRAWSKQKEEVSSDPSGLSYSHYKAGALDDTINVFDTALRGLPYQYGFSPLHWRQITDVEILKKAGVYDIDKMRTITLMDAAFNMNNKQLGRDVMAHAENCNNLAREQYGSRKHHQASTAAANKVLTMDLLRLRRQSGSLCSNDAKSCYDRVVHSIAALAFLRQGAPKPAVMSMMKTLQYSIHRIRTGYGVSDRHYGGSKEPPIQGLGQGNGAAPTGWAIISTPIIKMMHTAGFGLQLTTCLSRRPVSFLCYAFVDDTDLLHTRASVNTPGTDIIRDMRRFVQHWEGGLRATGGALRVDKSCWYLIDFVWRNNAWHYATKDEVPGNILVRDADGQTKILPRLEAHEANETLGIHLAMNGDQKAEVVKLRKKTSEFAEKIRTGFLQKDEAWHALHSTILKTLEYPMEAIDLTRRQWDYVMSPLLQSTLPRSGIARSFPRDLLYAPDTFTGLGIMHPFYKQNLRHLDLVLRETLKPSITSDLLHSILEQFRLEIGIAGTDGNWQLETFSPCLTDGWLLSLLKFCEAEEITLQDTGPCLPLGTSGDLFLMQVFADAGYRGAELRQLNLCRMYLRTVSLSDLCTADGRYITYDSFHGGDATRIREAGWPRRTPYIPPSHWTQWKHALTKCFLHQHTTNRQLRTPLGPWTTDVLPEWKWFFSPSEIRLYHAEGPFYRVYVRVTRGNTRIANARFSPITNLSHSLPPDAMLATVAKNAANSYILTGSAPFPLAPTAIHIDLPTASLDEIFDTMNPQDRWAVDNFFSEDEGQILAEGIIQGSATAVSDGSFKSQLGTSGFILRGPQRQLGAIGDNVVPGNPTEQSSYRSELAGISGILAVLAAVCKKYDIQDGSITLALDGEQALLKASSAWPLSPTDTDFDLLTDIRAKIPKLPIRLVWQWIRGHQDRAVSFDSLSGLAQDNVMADNIAKQRLNQCILDAHVPTSQRFGDEGWSISWRGTKLSKLDYSRLYSLMWTGPALDYWARKHRLEYGTILTIDWDTSGEALRSLSFARRRRLVKQASGHLGVGRVLQRWGLQNHSECPRCQGDETPIHVLRCNDPRAITVWETTLATLATWMLRKKTDPALQQAIMRRLQEWHDGQPISDAGHGSALCQAITNQNNIGWYPFLLGHVSDHWRGIQQAYYDSLSLDNTGKQWVKQLIVQLFNISWDLWEHRNGIKHNSLTPAKLRAIRLLDTRIRAEFHLGDTHLNNRDKRWFVKPLQTIIDTYTTVEKGQWLASVETSRWRWTRRHELRRFQQDASRQLLRNWMATTHPPPNPPA